MCVEISTKMVHWVSYFAEILDHLVKLFFFLSYTEHLGDRGSVLYCYMECLNVLGSRFYYYVISVYNVQYTNSLCLHGNKPKRLISTLPGGRGKSEIQHHSNCHENKQGTNSEFSLAANTCNFGVWDRNLLNVMVWVTAFIRCTFHCQTA